MRLEQGQQEQASSRTVTSSDRDVLAAGESEQRLGDQDVPFFNRALVSLGKLLESGGSCLLVVSFNDSVGRGIARDAPTQSETSLPKQGRVAEQICSRINLKLRDRCWSVLVASFSHKKWGLSWNNSKWLNQRRGNCESISPSEMLGWSECKISMDQILHFDLVP